MAIFIMQGRFTNQYVKGGVAAPEDRHAAMSRLCEQAGGRLISLWVLELHGQGSLRRERAVEFKAALGSELR